MRKFSAIFAAIVILLHVPVALAQGAAPAAAEQSVAERIDRLVSPYYKPDVPGATVIVVKDGKTLFRKAYGLADVGRKVPMTPETAMRLGSISKQFTAVGILMLADEGKLALSDDITKFLPGYPTQGKKISIEHLLTHTSGIVSYTSKPGFMQTETQDFTVEQMIDSFKNDPLEFEPGSRYRYNNSGYFLLGAIIEKVSGMPYAKFMAQRIFIPLGMQHTAYEGHERVAGPQAAGHGKTKDGFGYSKPLSMTQPYAAGALVSTVDDLARWDAAISSGKLLKEASLTKAFEPYRLSTGKPNKYGYGWEMDKLQGVAMISHGGAINGFNTHAIRLPVEKVYVAVLTNTESGIVWSDVVAKKAAALAIGKPYPEFKPVTLDAAALDAFAGTYEMDEGGQRVVRRDKDGLVLQRPSGPPLRLTAYSQNGFYVPWGLDYMEFARDAKGAVTQLTFYRDGNATINKRVGDVSADRKAVSIPPTAFDVWVGRYELAPNFVIELSRDGDKFYAQATGQAKMEIFPASETVFFSKVVDAELHLAQGSGGSLTLRQNGREIVGHRLP